MPQTVLSDIHNTHFQKWKATPSCLLSSTWKIPCCLLVSFWAYQTKSWRPWVWHESTWSPNRLWVNNHPSNWACLPYNRSEGVLFPLRSDYKSENSQHGWWAISPLANGMWPMWFNYVWLLIVSMGHTVSLHFTCSFVVKLLVAVFCMHVWNYNQWSGCAWEHSKENRKFFALGSTGLFQGKLNSLTSRDLCVPCAPIPLWFLTTNYCQAVSGFGETPLETLHGNQTISAGLWGEDLQYTSRREIGWSPSLKHKNIIQLPIWWTSQGRIAGCKYGLYRVPVATTRVLAVLVLLSDATGEHRHHDRPFSHEPPRHYSFLK